MHHIIYAQNINYKVALLIKTSALKKHETQTHYIDPLVKLGLPANEIIGFSANYNTAGNAPAGFIKSYLSNLLKALDGLGVTTLYVCDAAYFKVLTKAKKADANYGYVLPCAIAGYEHMDVVLGTNYNQLFHNPAMQEKLDLSLDTLMNHLSGTHVDIGKNIINSAEYPSDLLGIAMWLKKLQSYPMLTCDIETFSLKFWEAGIGTIAFAWDQNNGIAFRVDDSVEAINAQIRQMLKNFFDTYKGKIIFHNANFDAKVLIYQLYMNDLLDQSGLLDGLDVFERLTEDTKIIAYLATNSTAGNKLSLKDLAHEYAGNYAQSNINDITLIPEADLLEYNLVDCLATWYVYDKYYPQMVNDDQLEIYETVMKPSMVDLMQIELTGMALDMEQVHLTKSDLETLAVKYRDNLFNSPTIKAFQDTLRQEECTARNAAWKTKKEPLEYFNYVEFNPGSNTQLQKLLYDHMGFEPVDFTNTGLPATGSKTLKKLIHATNNEDYHNILHSLIGLSDVSKILNTFIKAFIENSVLKSDGIYYLHGSFNLGGTVSGRLSSSSPNLQNIPSGSKYAKHIKKCFIGPPDWIFSGADFNALEDVVNTLLTRDPNKKKILIDGFDGHMYRAYHYWPEKFPDIDITDVESVNSKKKKYDKERSDSKPVSFALQYQGTYHTLMTNCGFNKSEAMEIEANFHNLYQVSNNWVQDRIMQASDDGYAVAAFGLRIRTPVLAQTIINLNNTPYEAQAEARTLGNAISGQSYGLLNNRACSEFMRRVRAHPVYRYQIKPVAQIHDAIYLFIKNEFGAIKWANDNLVDCMKWQELPELHHDQIKLNSNLDLFYPTWNDAIELPNKATKSEIKQVCFDELAKREEL